jgi:hypothetical protein
MSRHHVRDLAELVDQDARPNAKARRELRRPRRADGSFRNPPDRLDPGPETYPQEYTEDDAR